METHFFPSKIFFINFSFSLPWYHYFLGFPSSFSHSFPISFIGSFSILPLCLMSFSSHLTHFWCLHLIPKCNYKSNAVNFQTSIFTQMSLEPSTLMSNRLKDTSRRTSYTEIPIMSKIYHFPKPPLSFFQKPCSCHIIKTMNSITIYSDS